MKLNSIFTGTVFLLVILAGCSREDGVPVDTSISVDTPNRFAQFLNPVAGLQAGDYTIVAATNTAGQAGSFTVTVTFDNGNTQIFNGSWTNSGGQDPASVDNPSFNINLSKAGGINILLESDSVDTYLYLLFAGSGGVAAENDDIETGVNTNSQIARDASRIDTEELGAAYYSAIDPTDAKTNLEDWKVANGYYEALNGDPNYSSVINARFRDTKDLGYGRGMRVWTNLVDGSFYAFVENFQVAVIPGQEYSTLNLEALINDDRQYHFGTNAIEFSTYPYGAGEPFDNGSTTKFAKFFSFDASAADKTPGTQDHANEFRLNTVDLDGRGAKAMPNACVYCHGGEVKPLINGTMTMADGTFRNNSRDGNSGDALNLKGDTNAKLQLIEVNSLEFWPESPYTKAEQEVFLKQINQAVYCTYPNPGNTTGVCPVTPPVAAPDGAWAGDFAREMAEGWYDLDPDTDVGGDGVPDFDSATFVDDYVPVGWRPDPGTGNPPPGADELFLKAVGPNCFICHSRRGVNFAGDPDNEHIDFSTYEKFIEDAELIKRYVYDEGVMPLSLRGYVDFWGNEEAPVIMASFLNSVLPPGNQIALNGNGGINQPGAPIADAGVDRTTSSPTRLFGGNSRFVNKYSWNIVSTPIGGEASTLADTNTASPLLTATMDGDYVIQLTASNGSRSDSDTVLIKINTTLPTPVDPKDIVFSDITTIFDNDCVTCHASGAITGIPVFWTASQPANGTTLYEEVLVRIDFNDPENSRLLTKPSGIHHNGGLRTGFDLNNPAGRQNYDTILNWILEGAREN